MNAGSPNPGQGLRDRRRPHPMPRARRALMVFIVLGVLGSFIALVWLSAELRLLMDKTRVPSREELERAALAFKLLGAVMSAAVLCVAIWIGHFAWRIHHEEVYPPPGSRHLRVRRVWRGPQARRVAYACYVLAAALAAAGLALAPLALRIMARLGL